MRIGVFCSGGDAPGMNACVRAVVRSAIAGGHEVVGVRNGYQGLLDADFHGECDDDTTPLMSLRSVSNIVQYGGTMLHTSRCQDFREEAGRRRAIENLDRHKIEALVPIGGDGTLRGAVELGKMWEGQIIGCPGTIDNDLMGTDYTIGFSTAVATAVDALDKLRDTAESHRRMFLVEVMGRGSGYLAVHSAIAGGAELACIPETLDSIPRPDRANSRSSSRAGEKLHHDDRRRGRRERAAPRRSRQHLQAKPAAPSRCEP